VELKDVTKRFREVEILEKASAEIDRGDKIALIGANGKGKSTLLRIIAGTESFDGTRKWGHNVEPAFYAQHQLESLNLENTVLDEMKEAGSTKTELELRTLLGCFLFSGDDSDKKIKVLSGGEKARVALAKTIISKANFLLLDEPTNHLDIHSNELLIDALKRYEGTIILVSHDRYFISKTANKIWEIVDHKIKEFKGTYEEWVEWNERMKARAGQEKMDNKESVSAKKTQAAVPKPVQLQEEPKKSPPIDKEALKKLQNIKKQFSKVEEEISVFNARKSELELKLASPEIYNNKEKFQAAEKDYSLVSARLTELNRSYEELFEKIMESEG
jgi:ATP-binding cassette subfamily F protein 3